MRRGFAIASCAAALFAASCGAPSYPQGKLAQSLVDVCKKEYNIDVQASLAQTTLGVLVEIPGLIDELRKNASGSAMQMPPVLVEGHYTSQAFDFRIFSRGEFTRIDKDKVKEVERPPREPSGPLKKLQQVSTALARACMSTDAPLEFYKLIARDPGPEGLDVIFAGHVMDSKRVQFYAISFGELQNRSEVTVRYQPERLSQQVVGAFLKDLRKKPLPQLLSQYTAPSKRFGDLLPKVLMVAVELRGEEEKLLEEEGNWPVKQIDAANLIVYVPLQAIKQQGALLFSVQLQEQGGTLLDIERLSDGKLPERLKELGAPETWKNSFFLEPLKLPEFLTEQIAKRVMSEFKTIDEELKKEDPDVKPATMQDVTKALVDTTAYIVNSYEFKGFKEIAVIDALKGTRWVVPSTQLDLYRRRNAPELKPIP